MYAHTREHEGPLGVVDEPRDHPQDVDWWPALKAVLLSYLVLVSVLTAAGLAYVHLELFEPLREADTDLSRWFARGRTDGWDDVAMFWSTFADTFVVVAIAAVAAVGLWLRHRRRDAALIVFALSLEAATFITVNNLVRRDRPPVDTLGESPTTFSFPSGHVAATIVLWGALALIVLPHVRSTVLRLVVVLAPAIVTGWVAWARVYRGMHFASDVLVGIVLGVIALTLTVGILGRHEHEREAQP